MVRYFLKRVLLMAPTFLAIMLVVFLLMSVLPGSNINEFSSNGGGDWLDGIFSSLNMTDSIVARYVRYIVNLAKGDFGEGRSSAGLGSNIFYRLGFTAKLALFGFLLSAIIGIPAGTLAAVKRGGRADKAVSVLTLVMSSLPSYALAVVLVLIFCLYFNLLPPFGFGTPEYYIMPTMVVAAGGVAMTTRMTRSAVSGELGSQYVMVLRAKGLTGRRIVWLHVMKNALGTVVASLTNLASQLLCGTLIAENFFSMPGICQLLTKSISGRNQHTVLGCVAVLSVILMMVNIVSDFAAALLSPRIKDAMVYGGGRQNGES